MQEYCRPSNSLSCVICFVDSLFVPRVQICHIPVVTAWIFFNDNLGFTAPPAKNTQEEIIRANGAAGRTETG